MKLRLALFYALIIECMVSALELDGTQSAALLLLMAATLIGLTHKRGTVVSPALLIAVAYALGFGLPMLIPSYYPDLWARTSTAALEYGALWAVRGFGALAIGYATVMLFGKPVERNGWRIPANHDSRVAYARFVVTTIGVLSLLAWLANAFVFGVSLTFIQGVALGADSAAGSLQQLLGLLSDLRYPFFLGFLILKSLGRTNTRLAYLCAGVLAAYAIEIVMIGSKGIIIHGVMVALLAPAFIRYRFSSRHLAVGAAALVAVYGSFAVITEYRAIMQDELLAGRNVFAFETQAKSFWSALVRSAPLAEASSGRITDVESSDVLSRFGSGLFSLANLMAFTGQQPPYQHAVESFLIPVYSVVPRALMPGRPSFFHSGQFANEHFGWGYGGISVSTIGSFYYAWGYWGIVLGMALLGALLALSFKRALRSNAAAVHWLVLLAFVLSSLIEVGATFQSTVTGFVRVALLLWILRRLYAKGHSSGRRLAYSQTRSSGSEWRT